MKTLLSILLLCNTVSASTMYVGADKLFTADIPNRTFVQVGNAIENNFVNNLTSDWRPESARLWTLSNNSLVQVDPNTSALVSTIPLTYTNFDVMHTFAFDSITGRMFGSGANQHPNSTQGFYEINVNTGFATLIGDVKASNKTDLYSMAFDNQGKLWASGNDHLLGDLGQDTLVNIDPNTLVVSNKVNLMNISGPLRDIAFRPEDNQLFGFANYLDRDLLMIDTITGVEAGTLYGGDVGKLSGIAFQEVPEPHGLLMFIVIVSLAYIYLRRR